MSLLYASRAAALVGSSMAAATALLIDPRALVDAEAGASDRLATCGCEPVGASAEDLSGTRSAAVLLPDVGACCVICCTNFSGELKTR